MSVEYQLKLCTQADSEMLSLVASATFLEVFADEFTAEDVLEHCRRNNSPEVWTKYLKTPEARAFVATVPPGTAPVGYAMLCKPELPEEHVHDGDIELKRIYLFSRYQRCGIGRALMSCAVEAARSMGSKRVLLGVYKQNDAAVAFYRSFGFEVGGERRFTIGCAVHEDFVMALTL